MSAANLLRPADFGRRGRENFYLRGGISGFPSSPHLPHRSPHFLLVFFPFPRSFLATTPSPPLSPSEKEKKWGIMTFAPSPQTLRRCPLPLLFLGLLDVGRERKDGGREGGKEGRRPFHVLFLFFPELFFIFPRSYGRRKRRRRKKSSQVWKERILERGGERE